MNRYVRLVGFVLLGFGTTCAVFFLLGLLAFPSEFGVNAPPSPQSSFSVPSTFVVSLFLGGAVSGYLCSQHVATKRGFVLLTPGLYFASLDLAIFVWNANTMMPGMPEMMLIGSIRMFLISWAGVGVGHYLRREIAKDRQRPPHGDIKGQENTD